MNKIINQDGCIDIAVGQEGSHIRNACVYNKTLPRLICQIRTVHARGDLDKHCVLDDLEEILKDDDIPQDKWARLIRTAQYYFDEELKTKR